MQNIVRPERGYIVSGALNVGVYTNASCFRVLVRCAMCAWRIGRISTFLLMGSGAVLCGPAFVCPMSWLYVRSFSFRSVFFSPSVSYIVMHFVVIYFVYLFHKSIVLVNKYE